MGSDGMHDGVLRKLSNITARPTLSALKFHSDKREVLRHSLP